MRDGRRGPRKSSRDRSETNRASMVSEVQQELRRAALASIGVESRIFGHGRKQPPSDRMPKQLRLSLPFAALAIGMLAFSARGQLFGSPPSRDVEQGAQVAKLVEQQIGLYSLPEAETYLRKVGDRLVSVINDARWKFSFQIVDQAEP